MPTLTIGIATGQSDYCIIGYPDTHVFEYTMEALRKQTCMDFEVVIADVFYDKRKNYFKEHPEDFPVLHVPVKPNIWLKRGCPAISATKNTYLMYARGEYVTNIGDCYYPDEHFVERMLQNVKKYRYVNHLYAIYRGEQLLKEDPRQLTDKATWGNLTMHIDDWVALNGYSELLDGVKCLEDCDMEFRIGVKDGNKDGIQLVLPHFKRQQHTQFPMLAGCLARSHKCVQLCFTILRKRDKRGIYRSNLDPLSEGELKFLTQCKNKTYPHICPYVGKQCKKIEPNKECIIGRDEDLVRLNNHPSLYFDLAEQRKDPYRAARILGGMIEKG